MSADLPEGVTRADIEEQAVTITAAAELLNSASEYLSAESGTPEEALAERRLDALAQRIASSDKMAGTVLLALASLVVSVAEADAVQEWFTYQGARITEALNDAG